MRMKLYKITIERTDVEVTGHAVAMNEQEAVVMVINHDVALGKTHKGFSVERVDHKVSGDRCKGLEELLTAGSIGFARYVDRVGWLLGELVDQQLSLFNVTSLSGLQAFVIAANENEASAIFVGTHPAVRAEHQDIMLAPAFDALPDDQRQRLSAILEFGPRGIAVFDEKRGWEVLP